MKASQFAFGTFAILNGAYGLPSRNQPIKSSVAKRDLPFPLADYEDCLDNKFKDGFNQVTPWAEVKCNNQAISFYSYPITGWESGIDCYEHGKEQLRERIKYGGNDLIHQVQIYANGGDLNYGCMLGVRSLPYHIDDYTNCLNNEVKAMREKEWWDDVVCPNSNIKFYATSTLWDSPKDCYHYTLTGLEDQIMDNHPNAEERVTHWGGWASCSMGVKVTF